MIPALTQNWQDTYIDEDNNLAITALVLALASLTVALGQVLAQYFATADGYKHL